MRVVSPVSQELRRLPSAREVLLIVLSEQRAVGTRWRSNAFNTPPGPGAKTSEESRKDNSSAYSAKGQRISRSPGGTQARSVQTAVGIAASRIRTMRRKSGFHCCRISSALTSATHVVCVP
ncbi:hypothetical protein TcCL_ESM11222 [Trypanosoma cruzi]|nr:hypothetical protein TcCL_ESM11222 [Trypanosoma cruzi]